MHVFARRLKRSLHPARLPAAAADADQPTAERATRKRRGRERSQSTQSAPPENNRRRRGHKSRRGKMGEKITAVLLYMRVILDHIIDFFFGLYWDKRKRVIPVPELNKKHTILAESAVSLAKKIRSNELRSEELVTALIERIKEVNPIINAIAAERYEAALAEAKDVDTLIAAGLTEEQWKQKPFLGVPFTTKESQSVKGMPLTMGLWARRKELGVEDSLAVAMLKEQGAILIASSNLPELLVWQETNNPVYGLTKNPHHTGRTVGGSSGAEAALVASYASPISLCSDIGGSTRMPAFYCGMFGYHPTPGTNSLKGVYFRKRDYDNSMFALGFIAKHAEDLAPLSKTICTSDKLKAKVDQEVNIKDIKVYYMESAPDYLVSSVRPELKAAMKNAINKLSQATSSTELAPQPYQHSGFSHMYRLWSYWMSKEPDNYAEMFNNFNGEANYIVELIKKVLGQSKHFFFTVLRLIELQLPLPDAAWAEQTTKDMRDDLISKLGDNGVLLLPSAPHAAPYHHSCLLRPYNFAYFAVVNALRCPTVQVPIGKNSEDLPLGIQVLAAPYNDALCLSVAKYLEKELGGAVMPCKIRD